MKPEDEEKLMELLESELVKRLEKRYGHKATVRTADEITQARRNGPKEVPPSGGDHLEPPKRFECRKFRFQRCRSVFDLVQHFLLALTQRTRCSGGQRAWLPITRRF